MTDILKLLTSGKDVTAAMAEEAMSEIIVGHVAPVQIGALLTALHFRPPTAQILTGFVRAFREKTLKVRADSVEDLIDVCGTGGDGHGTFNVSTTVAFVVAGAGQKIAKHGNRAVSSKCGSFDVLEALGVGFCDNEREARDSIERHGLSFMYAPSFHPAFRELAPVRKQLGFRTVMNALGPMLNPAGVRRQLIGVYSPDLVIPMAEALGELGAISAMVVHGHDGSDEISICAPTKVATLENGKVTVSEIRPEQFGLERAAPEKIAGGDARTNAAILESVVSGTKGAARDIVVLNSGAALVVGGKAETLAHGIELANKAVDSGAAIEKLKNIRTPIRMGAAQ